MKIDEVNALGLHDFVTLLGAIYEHSPWVAELVWHKRPFQSRDELLGLMRLEIEGSDRDEQLALVRAHPDLGTRAKIGDLSTREQKGAGLNQLTPDEYEAFLTLNRHYREKFGFPFIYAVRGSDKDDIQTALLIRLNSNPEDELDQALWEVHRIAAFRIADLIG